MGRPTKYTPELAATIVRGVRLGLPSDLAARVAGVSASTYWAWLMKATTGGHPELAAFVRDVKKAKAEAVCSAVAILSQKGGWRGAKFWLEKMCPDQFGPNSKGTRI